MLVNYFTLIDFNAFKEVENIIVFAHREGVAEKILSSETGKT
jgi:hypothetical protein